MNEENKGGSKNKWSRIFRKKWFFPAVYLTIAALLLAVVVWYQNLDNQIPEVENDQIDQQDITGDYIPTPNDDDAETVMEQQEVILMPVTDQEQAEIVTKFYDYDAEQQDKENALVHHNNRFYQSTGVDIAAANGETFDVVAALSGTVLEVKEDPLLGNVVVMSHENEVETYYASLGEVVVEAGAEVKQGEQIGTAGNNIFGKESGTHVYFQLDKSGKEVNPEEYFNQPVSKLDSAAEGVMEEGSESSEETESVEDPEATEETDESVTEDESSEESSEENSEESPEENSDENTDEEDENTNEETTNSSDASESA
ncbi:stage II sporulation protein [Virgibacillus indicus]|uniref:Stage II sporulation protein n=1 Tax=Virgibacillus indicus TaxID=2024554 RepID=A0A265N8V1_9BACI|nr:M23 family metallopeptidase [Virgibacillus indicus]OZU88423.1 stage II sporulation protein [Virgibacillus indicus]